MSLNRTCEASIEEFNAAVFEPDSPDSAYACGLLCHAAGLLKEAVNWLAQSIAFAPRSNTYLALGSSLIALGEWDDALAALLRATDLDPDLLPAYLKIGAIYRSRGRLDEAVRLYRGALDRFGKTRHSYYLHNELGLALEKMGDLEGAAKQLETAARARHIDTVPMLTNLALVHYKLRRFSDARKIVEQIIARRRNHPRVHDNPETCFLIYYVLGGSQLEEGDAEAARESFSLSLEFNTNSAPAYNSLALACVASGNRDEAIRALREAFRIDPGYQAARRNLDHLMGRAEAARQ